MKGSSEGARRMHWERLVIRDSRVSPQFAGHSKRAEMSNKQSEDTRVLRLEI